MFKFIKSGYCIIEIYLGFAFWCGKLVTLLRHFEFLATHADR